MSPDWVTAIATVVALVIALLTVWVSHQAGKRQERLTAQAIAAQKQAAADSSASQERLAQVALKAQRESAEDALSSQAAQFERERRDARRRAADEQLLAGRAELYAELLQVVEEQLPPDETLARLTPLTGRTWVYAPRDVARAFDACLLHLGLSGIPGDAESDKARFADDRITLHTAINVAMAATRVELDFGKEIDSLAERRQRHSMSVDAEEVPD